MHHALQDGHRIRIAADQQGLHTHPHASLGVNPAAANWRGWFKGEGSGSGNGSRRVSAKLLQLRVLRLGLLQDRQIRVSIFPGGEDVLVGELGLGAVALLGIGAGDAKLGEGEGFRETRPITARQDPLEFLRGVSGTLCGKICLATLELNSFLQPVVSRSALQTLHCQRRRPRGGFRQKL